MKEDVRALAAEFKAFLRSREEDDLTPAAFTQAAAPSANETETSSAKDRLTVRFVRERELSHAKPAPLSLQETPRAAEETELSAPVQTPVQTPAVSSVSSDREVPVSAAEKQAALDQIAQEIRACKRCPLGDTRLHAVPGEGNPATELMFIGEGPGFDEDHQGRPFIGRAGQLLDKMIAAMGLKREDVFIGNIAKCHPMVNPQNPEARGNDRAPNQGEIAVCRKYIERQIAAISPKYVVALGGVAAKALISDTKSLGALRGRFHLLHLDSVELKTPVKILATYHPAALLRNPGWKKDAWADLQMVMAEMGLKRPAA